MKKYMILAAVAALTLASCAKIETNTRTVWDEDVPIGFSTYSPRNLTKAGGTYTEEAALPSASKIGVYGYSTPATTETNPTDHFLGTEKPTFITNGQVSFTDASNSPTGAAETRYWPKDIKNLLSFYGYYPYNDAVITSKPVATTNGLGSFVVTQKNKVEEMVDFMISDVQNDMYYWDGVSGHESANVYGRKSTISGSGTTAIYGIVPLTLHHMMSNVNFYFKTNISDADVTIKVTDASIAGVLSSGKFTPSYEPLTSEPAATASDADKKGTTTFAVSDQATAYTDAVKIKIGSTDNTDDFAYIVLPKPSAPGVSPVVTPDPVINYVDKAGTKSYNNFLFIPQDVTDDILVTIKYVLTQGTEETTNVVTVKLAEAKKANNDPITEWKYNHKYNYIFTIGLNEILFTGQATTWDDGGNGFITVL